MKTVEELYLLGKSLLECLDSPDVEARLLLCFVMGLSDAEFYATQDISVGEKQKKLFLELIERRLLGEPLAYITRQIEFWSYSFHVEPGVLLPRPETELIVAKVLELVKSEDLAIVDIGTGSGNIAISLAKELPDAQVVATDVSKKAHKIAQINAKALGISNISFELGDLFLPLGRLKLEGKCDFIVSNPPYVAENEWETLQREIREHEPKEALVAGETGLEVIERLIAGAPVFLKSEGYLIFEIGYGQKQAVLHMFEKEWGSAECFDDLAGIPRVVLARKRGQATFLKK